ncbi:alpha/beta fold hydrolase [Actinoplanes sp. NPDC049316]|uniref:alpha/beta fold hydrolase n=1 Tax=Actinoplanes sp. NPDC049316 TaxID=3154727 RepID=UPI003418D372
MLYRFGECELDTEAFEVRSAGRIADVEPQVFEILACLLANRTRVVPKEELREAVWGNRFVSDSALTTRIKQARKAIGDDGRTQQFIKTVYGRGYRFVGEVSVASATSLPEAASDSEIHSVPPTRYVVNDDASIAYQCFGDGPNLVLIEGFATNVEVQWEHPAIARFLLGLGTFCRVAVMDKRGTGLSERLGRGEAPPLDQRADDVRAVMDAAGMDRATVFGSSEGGSLSILLAATHPERVERLVLHGTWARHPWLGRPDRPEFAAVERYWGSGRTYAWLASSIGATAGGRRFLGRLERQGATPGTARRLAELMSGIDVTPLLPSIHVPVLVVHRSEDAIYGIGHAHDLVRGIPDAELVELPGSDHFLFSGDTGPILAAVQRFVTGSAPPPARDRFLATVLFVVVADAGGFAPIPDGHIGTVRRIVQDHQGELISVTADGLLCTFDGPGRGVRAACRLRDALAPLGATVRAGVHTAEVERRGDRLAGMAVSVAGGLARAADPGTVLVSRTVIDLVAGWGLAFAARSGPPVAGLPVFEAVA